MRKSIQCSLAALFMVGAAYIFVPFSAEANATEANTVERLDSDSCCGAGNAPCDTCRICCPQGKAAVCTAAEYWPTGSCRIQPRCYCS